MIRLRRAIFKCLIVKEKPRLVLQPSNNNVQLSLFIFSSWINTGISNSIIGEQELHQSITQSMPDCVINMYVFYNKKVQGLLRIPVLRPCQKISSTFRDARQLTFGV